MKWSVVTIAALFVVSLAWTTAYAEGWRVAEFTDSFSFQELQKDMHPEGGVRAEPTVLREEKPVIEEKESPEMFKYEDKFLPIETQRWDG